MNFNKLNLFHNIFFEIIVKFKHFILEISERFLHINSKSLFMKILPTVSCESRFIWNKLFSNLFITINLSLSTSNWISWIIVFVFFNFIISKVILHIYSATLVCFLRLSWYSHSHSATFIFSRSRIASMNFKTISTVLFLTS